MSSKIKFKNVLVCAPGNITLTGFLQSAFSSYNSHVNNFDAVDSVDKSIRMLYQKSIGLKWLNYIIKPLFIKEINKKFIRKIREVKYDLIFIYNSEYLSPRSLEAAKSQGAILVNYLGDNPFYTSIYEEGIFCLKYFDIILSPDKFWIKCLTMLDLEAKILFMLPGANPVFKNLESAKISKAVFVGSNYTNKEGFKRASLFNSIADRIHIYGGRSWLMWFTYFKDLKNVYFESPRISDDELNVLLNRYRLAIVDANTGIVAGIHQRLLDISQTGCLPLVEWRYDLKEEFSGLDIFFSTPFELKELIDSYLRNESLRRETLHNLSLTVREKFNSVTFFNCIK